MTSVPSALRQARQAIRQTIEDNPVDLRITRAVQEDNGLGMMVPDPTGERNTVHIRGRIAPIAYGESRVAAPVPTPPGVGVPERQFLLVAHDGNLIEGDELEYNGHTWTVGPVAQVFRFGGVVAKQAPLSKGAAVEVVA